MDVEGSENSTQYLVKDKQGIPGDSQGGEGEQRWGGRGCGVSFKSKDQMSPVFPPVIELQKSPEVLAAH